MLSKKCQYRGCENIVPPGRIKYCSDRCRHWENQCKKDTVKPFSVAQHIRMAKAARKQKSSAVRYN